GRRASGRWRMRSRASMPFILGRRTSRMTRATPPPSSRARPLSASGASSTRSPAPSRTMRIARRMFFSSSTTRTVALMAGHIPRRGGSPVVRGMRGGRLDSQLVQTKLAKRAIDALVGGAIARFRDAAARALPVSAPLAEELALEAEPALRALVEATAGGADEGLDSLDHHETLAMATL